MAKGDIFLKIDSQRGGTIAGESNDTKHRAEIDVVGWSWGMQQPSAMGAQGQADARSMPSPSPSMWIAPPRP